MLEASGGSIFAKMKAIAKNALPENRQGAGVMWVTCCKQRGRSGG